MKLLLILLSLMFLLSACGEETLKKGLEQKEDYRYVEIEECTIPIAKKLRELKVKANKTYPYRRFSYTSNIISIQSLDVRKSEKESYINSKTFLEQSKNNILKSDYERSQFKILEWSLVDPILDEIHYVLFGPKTKISLTNSNKTELNYLLDYCQKTWKLDKGEK